MKMMETFVEFGVKGFDKLKAGFAAASAHSEKLNKNIDAFGRKAAVAFAAVSGTIMGFVRAGIQGTTHGERLAVSFQLLSREIAQVFLPTVEAVTAKVQAMVSWFRGLSGAQQDSIRHWALTGTAILGVGAALPKLIGLFGSIITGAKAAGAAFGVLTAATGGWAALIAAVAVGTTAFVAWYASTERGQATFARLSEAAGRLMTALNPLWDALQKIGGLYVDNLVSQFELIATAIEFAVTKAEQLIEALNKISNNNAINILFPMVGTMNKVAEMMGGDESKKPGSGVPGSGGKSSGADSARHQLTSSKVLFEGFAESNRRLQVAAGKTDSGKPVEEKQLEAQLGTTEAVRALTAEVSRKKGAIGE